MVASALATRQFNGLIFKADDVYNIKKDHCVLVMARAASFKAVEGNRMNIEYQIYLSRLFTHRSILTTAKAKTIRVPRSFF